MGARTGAPNPQEQAGSRQAHSGGLSLCVALVRHPVALARVSDTHRGPLRRGGERRLVAGLQPLQNQTLREQVSVMTFTDRNLALRLLRSADNQQGKVCLPH